MAKFALLQRQFLTKMYKSVGYLQNYHRTDKKKRRRKKNPVHLWNIFSYRSMLKRRVVITWSDIWRHFEPFNILIKIHLHVYLCLILFLNFNKALIKNVLCTSISVDRHFDSIIKCVTLQEKALVSIFRFVTISHVAIQNT